MKTKTPSPELAQAARLMGRKGGTVTASRMTAEQRVARAKHAIAVRWARAAERRQHAPKN